MSNFGFNKGFFPFCAKKVDSASEENDRYNSFFSSGANGIGEIYPIGMILEDAMALYWRLKKVDWDFSASRSTTSCNGICSSYSERSSIGPYWCYDQSSNSPAEEIYKPPNLKEGASDFDIIRKRSCTEFFPDIPLIRPDFTNAMKGPIRYYNLYEGDVGPHDTNGDGIPDCTCPNDEIDTEEEETPVTCFFRPCFGPNCGTERNPEFARVIYEESSQLYYPSFFCFYWTYSRLWVTQKFIGESYEVEQQGSVSLEINDNSYSMPLYAVYNYTADDGPPEQNHGPIICTLANSN